MKFKLPHRIGLARLSILGVLVGIIAGAGAVFFRDLIGLIHNVAFSGDFSIEYDANQFTPPSPWGAFIIVVPAVGGLIVTYLVEKFAPEARGHGVPEVIDAIYYREGVIRPVVGVVKSLASAVSIGTGAAVGREGPIAQIGASFGSLLGQIIGMAPWQRVTLVAAGAGAGIAATFNTPIGGVMFAVELMMPELSARTFLPVALATGTALVTVVVFGYTMSFGTAIDHSAAVNNSAIVATGGNSASITGSLKTASGARKSPAISGFRTESNITRRSLTVPVIHVLRRCLLARGLTRSTRG